MDASATSPESLTSATDTAMGLAAAAHSATDTSGNTPARPEPRAGSATLAVLTLCAFTLGTGEIMIAGLLPDIAADAGVSLSTAGLLVSVFAATVVVGGPVLALTTSAVGRVRLLVTLFALFVTGTAMSALTSSFPLIAGGRVAAALAHSALMPLFFGLAADAVPPQRRGTAVARVSLGFSLATIVGLPLGTAIGHWFSWRLTFWAVALLALAAAGPVVALGRKPYEPTRDGAEAQAGGGTEVGGGKRAGRLAELRVLGERRVRAVIAVTALSAAGAFTAYTYITPLLTDTTGFSASATTVLLLLFGIGGTVGNLVSGRLADRSVMAAVCAGVAALAAALPLLGATATVKPLAVVFLFLFGAAYYGVIPAVNTRLMNVAPARARNFALTVQSSAFNLGIALGGWLGGEVIASGVSMRWVPVAGGLVTVCALGLALAESRARTSA
ncbi:MFS transporter [Streptomyces milbemycinicus]|uniref:MFS transporter n=1 Tax=Streptomyces milbemycinicus TaxID=476552 RepID=UPI0033F8CCF4